MSASAGSTAPHRSVVSIRGGAQPPAPSTNPQTPPRPIPASFGSPSTLRAEEDVIVIEIGSRFVRVGFAGDNAPRVRLQLPPEQQRRLGDHRTWASGYQDDWTKRATGEEWGADYELWRYDLRSVDLGLVEDKLDRLLREAFSKHLLIDSKPRRAALVLPSSLPLPLLSTTLDVLFNHFQSPMVSLLSSASMSTLSSGLRSALVVDLGWAETVVTSEALRENGFSPPEGGEEEDSDHVISFGECEDICTRAIWCKPAQKRPPAVGLETGLPTVQEQDEYEVETFSATRENKTIRIPLRSTQPHTELEMSYSQLADACENTYFGERTENPSSFDDEELPVHQLIYQHLLRLPLDVRAICMSRLVFTGGKSGIIGLKGRIFDEVASLIQKRGWDPVTGRGFQAMKDNRKRSSRQAAPGPTKADAEEDDGVWHDAANEPSDTNAIVEKVERRKPDPPLQGQLRAVESLGPWCGASLACQLKILAIATVERENWAQHGASGASKPGEVDIKAQQRQSMGPGGLMRGMAGGQDRAWTLGVWGYS
ncbi:related to actin-related protein RO7 [Cephalotrichum gorgonifer]|uniref:Related to actin-related protein RO7 n=1 Tax=Cephalotrichum gorgonifer TaxID=2041049 RepID=A0AAE8SZ52_9PEZI|nr:related to actin-related protein RO7 [Cephalotrichum gorgonifer]